jgi:predicted ATPase
LKTSKDKNFTKSYRDIVDTVKTIAPYFHDFYLEPRGSEGEEKVLLKWTHRDREDPFSANQLSDGTARFICMAVLFLQPNVLKPKSIVLDEPELGLHPAALEVLSELVKLASKDNQVICSTQSVTFANQFNAKDFIVVDQDDGASTFKRIDEKELEAWLEDYAMGDIWTKNIIGGRPEW